MTHFAVRRYGRRSLLLSAALLLLVTSGLAVLPTPSLADEEPKPDPAGLATGDKTTAVDAAGNPFVVSEPTDKSAPDYAQKKTTTSIKPWPPRSR